MKAITIPRWDEDLKGYFEGRWRVDRSCCERNVRGGEDDASSVREYAATSNATFSSRDNTEYNYIKDLSFRDEVGNIMKAQMSYQYSFTGEGRVVVDRLIAAAPPFEVVFDFSDHGAVTGVTSYTVKKGAAGDTEQKIFTTYTRVDDDLCVMGEVRAGEEEDSSAGWSVHCAMHVTN